MRRLIFAWLYTLLAFFGQIATASASATIVNWGLTTGSNPRSLCVYDVGSSKTCDQIGRIDSTRHTVALNIPGFNQFSFSLGAVVNRLKDRAFVGGATAFTACCGAGDDWFDAYMRATFNAPYGESAQFFSATDGVDPNSGTGGVFASETTAALADGNIGIGLGAFVINNSATHATSAWAIYAEGTRANSTVGITYAAELEINNLGDEKTTDPFVPIVVGATVDLILGTNSYNVGGQANATTALIIGGGISGVPPLKKWNAGIDITNNAISAATPDSRKHAIQLPIDNDITWYSAAATIAGHLTVDAFGTMRATSTNGLEINGCFLGTSGNGITCTSAAAFAPQIKVANQANDTSSGYLIGSKEHGVAGAVVSGDTMLTILSTGYANAGMRNAGGIQFMVAAAPSGSNVPSKILFNVTDAAGTASMGMTLDNNVHHSYASSGVPALSSCGTGSPAMRSGSTDVAGEVTEGTTAAGCTLSWKVNYSVAPFCTVTMQTQQAAFSYTVSNAGITVTNTSASGLKWNYVCHGI